MSDVAGPTREIPDLVRRVLAAGSFCWLGVTTASGPHVTPLVYASYHDRLWVTTARGSVKAKRWKHDGVAGALVRGDGYDLSLRGEVTLHDALDPGTWFRAVRQAPVVSMATAEFVRKNARFFAGYARDARRVPLAWTPPGRVFAEISLDAGVVSDASSGEVIERWGSGRRRGIESAAAFRRTRAPVGPFASVPPDVRQALGSAGDCVVGLAAPSRGAPLPAVLPARWALDEGGLFVAVREELTALAGGVRKGMLMSVTIDHAPTWRAADMSGVLAQGEPKVFLAERVRTGGRGVRERLEQMGGEDDWMLARLAPSRVVWWHGWSSGTVRLG